MTTDPPARPKKISVALQVTNEVEARELNEAWHEIVSGKKLARTEALEHGTEAVMERAREALKVIERAIREHPTTGHAGRLVRFLAAIYNGYRGLKLGAVLKRGAPHQTLTLALALLVALRVGGALGQTETHLSIRILSDDTCLVHEVPVPCRDVGAKLRELGTPSDVNIHVTAENGAKYEAVASTLESLKQAGFKVKAGTVNVRTP